MNDAKLIPSEKVFLRTPLVESSVLKKLHNLSIDIILDFIKNDSLILESIFIANPLLHKRITDLKQNDKVDELFKTTLLKYLIRMAYRATPYGLFGGVSELEVTTCTEIILSSPKDWLRQVRLDMHVLCAIIDKYKYSNDTLYFPNNTIYDTGKTLRYVEYQEKKVYREYMLASIEKDEYIELILDQASTGKTLAGLVKTIVDTGIEESTAYEYIKSTIDSKILISNLEPSVITNATFSKLKSAIPDYKKIKELLNQIGVESNANVERYKEIQDKLRVLNVEFDENNFIQLDLYKPLIKGEIDKKRIGELSEAIIFLSKINNPRLYDSKDLNRFKKKFVEKYDEQEVPLLEVLDPDYGIGFPIDKPRIKDDNIFLTHLNYASNTRSENKSVDYVLNDTIFKRLQEKLIDTLQNNEYEIVFTDYDLESDANSPTFPSSLYSLCTLVELDGSDTLLHDITTGPSASQLIARFGFMTESLSQFCNQVQKYDQQSTEFVIAEINHLVNNRIGNILIHSNHDGYEIPIVSPGFFHDKVIPLSDLMVSVNDDRVFLRSKNLKKFVEPRLTTAHNFTEYTTPHYHFLCALQFQANLIELGWNWGTFVSFPVLPRVKFKKVVLSAARWNFTDLCIGFTDWEDKFNQFSIKYKLPEEIVVANSDTKLLVNRSLQVASIILFKEYKRNNYLIMEEHFPESNLIKDSAGRVYRNELIVPFFTKVKNEIPFRPANKKVEKRITRTFNPGVEWLFYKIYCSEISSNQLLVKVIEPLIRRLTDENSIEKWFFIRYADPQYHLRLRLKYTHNHREKAMNTFNSFMADSQVHRLVSNVSIHSYSRELERYGNEITESESLFSIDSHYVLNILTEVHKYEDSQDLFKIISIMIAIDHLLTNTGFDTTTYKIEFCKQAKDEMIRDLDINRQSFNKSSSKLFRKNFHNKTLESLTNDLPADIRLILEERIHSIDLLFLNKHDFQVEFKNIIGSHIHMSINRMFKVHQPLIELAIYDYLFQLYRYEIKRNAKLKK
ncbi:hypothetical protein FNH22_18620 [Fulvivirga sp. M361]|uniref:lantibiotic dehydratase n=1 Tax=Fulvivirga sp. M361 TaxID=2594266 RepID=UPI00117BCFD7|nr:lantibiotic dehydratase [Fulvivirga sp. M361]TRX54777.1 hypothetical protein FNH22_18620 [Fulvivirga sp. M361]